MQNCPEVEACRFHLSFIFVLTNLSFVFFLIPVKVFGSDNIHIFVISMKNLHFISKHDLHFNGNTEKEIVDYIKNKPVS